MAGEQEPVPTDRELIAKLIQELRETIPDSKGALLVIRDLEEAIEELFDRIEQYRDDIRQGRHTVH